MLHKLFLPLAMLAFVVSAAATSSLPDGTSTSCYPPLSLVTSSIPSATAGIGYSVSLTANGGQPPYTWSFGQSSLPQGFSLSSNGALSGTPSTAGTYTFNAIVSDALKNNVTGLLTLTATSNSGTPTSTPTTYYLSPAGSDSNSGLSSSLPWLTPKHAVNCGDVILAAASTAYSAANFTTGEWGTVTCAAGNNVAWLKCATFDACKISGMGSGAGIAVGASYWGIQGWEVDGTMASGPCFFAYPHGSTTIHHIIFANDIASDCGLNGFDASNAGTSGVDYIVVVGSIAYNDAGGSTYCGSGISIYQPIQSDSLPGTHIYVAGNFSYGNLDGNPCGGGTPTDGEGIIFDTFDGSQGGVAGPYCVQAVADNNILVANGGKAVVVFNNTAGSCHAGIYARHNTTWGNNNGVDASCGGCGEIDIDAANTVEVFANLIQNTVDYALSAVNLPDSTVHMYNNFAYSAAGQNTFLYHSGLFAFGPNNAFGTNPNFANPVAHGAPNCGNYASVPACMATVIANFAPTNTAAIGYGYQVPSSTETYDPLFPQWLCNVNLPAGLVTMGCLTEP